VIFWDLVQYGSSTALISNAVMLARSESQPCTGQHRSWDMRGIRPSILSGASPLLGIPCPLPLSLLAECLEITLCDGVLINVLNRVEEDAEDKGANETGDAKVTCALAPLRRLPRRLRGWRQCHVLVARAV
jgi:hypothetical protein